MGNPLRRSMKRFNRRLHLQQNPARQSKLVLIRLIDRPYRVVEIRRPRLLDVAPQDMRDHLASVNRTIRKLLFSNSADRGCRFFRDRRCLP